MAFFFLFFSIAVCDYIWIEEKSRGELYKTLTLKPPKLLIFFFACHWSSVIKTIITSTLYFLELAVT